MADIKILCERLYNDIPRPQCSPASGEQCGKVTPAVHIPAVKARKMPSSCGGKSSVTLACGKGKRDAKNCGVFKVVSDALYGRMIPGLKVK